MKIRMSIKKFYDFILEKIKRYSDEYSKLDKTFIDFNLSHIPKEQLKKQFKNFKIYLTPLSFNNPLDDTIKKERINEEIKHSFNVDKVRESIMEKYFFMDWQFEVKEMMNNIKIAIIIPHIEDNVDMIIDDMYSMGYYESFRNELDGQGLPYVLIRFEPRFPDDITNQIRNMSSIYHWSPKYNFESIQRHGFVPQSKNNRYKYPPRIHFIKSNIDIDEIENLGRQLCKFNDNIKNNGEYILYTIDTQKIPNNVIFIGNCNYKYGICTEDTIPYISVISTREFKF